MTHRAVLIPGDGVGPDVTRAACRIVAAAGVDVSWDVRQVGLPAVAQRQDPLPGRVIAAIESCGVALKGPVSTPADGSWPSVNVALRRGLDLFVQVRRCRTFPGVPSRFTDVDLLIARETTEDLYAGIEFDAGSRPASDLVSWLLERGVEVAPKAAFSLKPISEQATRRAARAVLRIALAEQRDRVTIVHKATAMPATDGVFLGTCRRVASEVGVEVEDRAVDLMCAELVRRPEAFDVLLTTNLYGDILADLAGGIVGSVGLVAGVNLGEGVAVFEPGHGSAPRHVGRDDVNPVATVLSAAMLLRHIGEPDAAVSIEAAVAAVLAAGDRVTYDVARPGTSPVAMSAMVDAIIERLG